MKAPQFLEYLYEHPATRVLAEELAGVLGLRGRPDLIPIGVSDPDSRRIAS
jgi:hypothetical protein